MVKRGGGSWGVFCGHQTVLRLSKSINRQYLSAFEDVRSSFLSPPFAVASSSLLFTRQLPVYTRSIRIETSSAPFFFIRARAHFSLSLSLLSTPSFYYYFPSFSFFTTDRYLWQQPRRPDAFHSDSNRQRLFGYSAANNIVIYEKV